MRWNAVEFFDSIPSSWPDGPCVDQQADEVLRELASLFKGFGQLAPGSMGRRALDPTGLRLALAKLDPKRFAAGSAAACQRSSDHPVRGGGWLR